MTTADMVFTQPGNPDRLRDHKQDARMILWALLAAILIHLLVAFLLAAFSGYFSPALPAPDKPVELTFMDLSPASAPKTISHIKAPHLITATPPQYPAIAKQNRIQGDVTIEMDIDESGNVSSEKVISGPPFLQGAAKDAVRRWKYEPATLNDKPIPYHMQVKVHFALQ